MDRDTMTTLVGDALDRLRQDLSITNVFGAPVTVGEMTIIPVASVVLGFGGGGGSGSGPAGATAPDPEAAGVPATGSGAGGGGGGRATPRGYIEIGPKGARFVPIIDQTRVALAGILMVAWNVFWISLTIRAAIAARHRQGAGAHPVPAGAVGDDSPRRRRGHRDGAKGG